MEEEKELTPEEITKYKQQKEDMLTYYNDQIPFMEIQLKYEMLITQLVESQARRLNAQRIIADIKAPAPESNEDSKESKDLKDIKERKLRKES